MRLLCKLTPASTNVSIYIIIKSRFENVARHVFKVIYSYRAHNIEDAQSAVNYSKKRYVFKAFMHLMVC